MNPIVKDDLLEGIKSGDIWLNKVKYEMKENESGVTYASKFTCPHVEHASYSMSISVPASLDRSQRHLLSGMSELCDLHSKTGVGETGEYLDPSIDRQVGLGVLGLANLLRRAGVSYRLWTRIGGLYKRL